MSRMNIKYMVRGMVSTNIYLVQNTDTQEIFVVDPADDAEGIAAAVDEMGGTLAAILLTHGHHDHILAVDALREKYGVPVIAHELEQAVLGDPSLNLSASHGFTCAVAADRLVKEGDILEIAGFSVRVLHTPGHTAGSSCYYIEDEKVLFAGDTMFCGSYGRTDFPTGSMQDMEESIRRLLTELPDDVAVCPGHESFTSIEFEKKYNPLRIRG